MINPNYTEGIFLFVVDDCGHCAFWKKFVRELNIQLKPSKKIRVIDCTYYDLYDILTDPIIKLYEDRLDGYPVFFHGDSRKDGAESILECKAWLFGKLFNNYIFPQNNEILPTIGQPLLFNKNCKFSRGRLVCE